MSNQLINEKSPYLLQHAENPVDWYPWGKEAFDKAKREDKPIFLSIGYSTCHWCHVMAHESFEDAEVADKLNHNFVSIKVDKEERPDIDSIYMSVCQAFTGSGGWPTSIFMTANQKPFFAGTYFPKRSRRGMPGLMELLDAIQEKWTSDRAALLTQAEEIVRHINRGSATPGTPDESLPGTAAGVFKYLYDSAHGGFGSAPKFPTPHNLLFLMAHYEFSGDRECLDMAEHTLLQMYRGGLFDHIGGGFCRYSTDERYLVPHFEKMLYDNALLITAYCRAWEITKKPLYLDIARRTADYVLGEMTSPGGGFYSAQDADSDGEEGKYYVFTPDKIISLLGEKDGGEFCRRFDITARGNFEGKSIPNLLKSREDEPVVQNTRRLYEYRKSRCALHLDDKVLTSWNSLMISAMCRLYRASGKSRYLAAAEHAWQFIHENLCENGTLFASFRDGARGHRGFLDDYAFCCAALLELYGAALEPRYLELARRICEKALSDFGDKAGGFYLYSYDSEQLISRPKETYDGAMPSGNSMMAWVLGRLSRITGDERYEREWMRQLEYLAAVAEQYPHSHSMYLLSLMEHFDPPDKITVVPASPSDLAALPCRVSPDSVLTAVPPSGEYPLKNGKTTYYVCRGHRCLPPENDLPEINRYPGGILSSR